MLPVLDPQPRKILTKLQEKVISVCAARLTCTAVTRSRDLATLHSSTALSDA